MTRQRAVFICALLFVCGTLPAEAQSAPPTSSQAGDRAQFSDARWAPWIGCWTPAARSCAEADAQLCVLPSEDLRGVRMTTFVGNNELASETTVADGTPQSIAEQECSGERTSRWAQSGSRLFLTATLRCAGRPDMKTSGISALVTADQWIDAKVTTVGGRDQVRVRRFWRSSEAPPAPVADALGQLAASRPAAAPITVDDVIEASSAVAATAVEAWLTEANARPPIDRAALVRLADAEVSPNVIDLMVALAYPSKLQVRRTGSGGGFFGAPEWGYYGDIYGSYFLGGFGYYPPGGYWDDTPGDGGGGGVIEDARHGQVVNGQGYTRVQPRETYRGTSAPRGGGSDTAESSGNGASGSDSGSSSSGASPSGYSGGGGTSTGITAVPR